MKSLNLQTEDQKSVFWKSFDRDRWLFLNYSTRVFSQSLKNQIDPVIRYMRENGISEAGSFIENQVSSEPIRAGFNIVYQRVGSHFGGRIFESLTEKSLKQEDDWTRAVMRYVALQATDRVEGITLTSKTKMAEELAAGVSQGLGIDDIASRMAQSVGGVARAVRIARTEIISASNLGSLEGARATGLNPGKIWISTRDDRTRGSEVTDQFDHVSPDGQKTETLDGLFIISGERMLFPGDYSNRASLGNLIMCRCTQGYITR